jgi:uncharacterized hydrophobic protein (TIGR00271 family)
MDMNEKQDVPQGSLLVQALHKVRQLFHISLETDREGAIATIRDSVEFKGNNLWSLIIAIFIASIGLNLNSPAVIIGAMLISPLMGPITGAGLALAIYDLRLLKRSLLNLALMTAISMASSFVYFKISPLSGATSEILARTTPTFYDVFIAIFGGTALIISLSRKTRSSNTLAGVAIATALMPPLCSAGFGLASGNFAYFIGAFYLYLINSVFIGLTTFAFSKYLRLGESDKANRGMFTRRNLTLVALVFVLFITPSIFMGYGIIRENDYRRQVDRFVETNLRFADTQVLGIKRSIEGGKRIVEVSLVGKTITDDMIGHLKLLLPEFGLEGVELRIVQGGSASAPLAPSSDQVALSQTSSDTIQRLQGQITDLEGQVARLKDKNVILDRTTKEVLLLFPTLERISYGDMLVSEGGPLEPTRKYTVLVKWSHPADTATMAKLKLFLKLRLELEDLEVVEY